MTEERRCSVCDHTSGIDAHHEIPQAYGGTNGPQIDLCSGHHTLVHTLALQLYKHNDERRITLPFDVPVNRRHLVLRLVRTIVIARRDYEKSRATGQAPRKGTTVKVDGKRMERVVLLTRTMGCSQQEVVQTAIDRLFQSMSSKTSSQQQAPAVN